MKNLFKTRYFVLIFLLILSIFEANKISAKDKLIISAIPDQNPEHLNRMYKILASELADQLKVSVQYKPLTNYPAAVTAFRTKSLDLVWFGGLTGTQARLQSPGSKVIAQRDIDEQFHSVFIANKKSNLPIINDPNDLKILKGRRFTYGSESSTSGRLMPQYYLQKAGVENHHFKRGNAGFSGSHDSTIALVQSGSYEAGALNEQVWKQRLSEGKVNPKNVIVIWRTPSYVDYHWLSQPNLDERFGKGFTAKLKDVLLSFNKSNPRQKEILELFGAESFIPAYDYQYLDIEQIGRKIGKIR